MHGTAWPICALVLTGCASAPPPQTSARDCAVLMLAAGFIAEHQPPLRLDPVARALPVTPEPPELWSPDADPAARMALDKARRSAAAERIACPLEKSPFAPWRPGRAELRLSPPAYSPAGDFAVFDAVAALPGRRADHYRFMLSGPPSGAWDIHRITFDSLPSPPPQIPR